MAEPRKYGHDRHDPRAGRTNPTGPQGSAEQAAWQGGKSGETAMREVSTEAASRRPSRAAHTNE